MSDQRVLVTEPIIDEAAEMLKDHFSVDTGKRGTYDDEEQLKADIPKYDALLSMLSNPVTGEVLKNGQDLKIVANLAVGYDNIDIQSAQKRGIHVSNTPGVLSEATADLCFSLLLSTARRICEAEHHVREGRFDGWDPLGFLGIELNKRTLGILGMGRIGTAVARRARGFGMEIMYHNRNRIDKQLEEELDAEFAEDIHVLARKSDILSLNCPLTEETHHIVDESVLSKLGTQGILINTARGPVVVEEELARALHRGTIWGAGLDVYEKEPEIHPDLLEAPRCVMTPHIGSATYTTRRKMGMLAVNSIIGILTGQDTDEISNLIC